jgi:prepilin-type processing-associated H-X9-DG protein
MGMALQMYVHENGSKYPYLRGIRDPSHDNVVGAANTGWWWAKLLPYYQVNWMDRAYHCPGYKGAFTGVGDHHGPLGSYAYNAKGVSFGSGFADPKRGIYVPSNPGFGLGRVLYYSWPWLWPSVPVISEAQIKMPSGMFAIGESRFFDAKVNGIPGGDCDALCGLLSWRPARDGGRKNSFAFDPARHGKNYNQLFCDGHVTAMSPWVLFNPTNTASMWNSDHQPHCELWVTDD